jgi:hypothetical protein
MGTGLFRIHGSKAGYSARFGDNTHPDCRRQVLSLEYEARALGIDDSPDGKKVLVFRTVCGRTVKVFVSHQQADFTIKELNQTMEPCA